MRSVVLGTSFTTHPTERWIEFVRHIIAAEAKLNHTVLVFRVDRAPELDNVKFVAAVEALGHRRLSLRQLGAMRVWVQQSLEMT